MPQLSLQQINSAMLHPEEAVSDAERRYQLLIEDAASRVLQNPQIRIILLAGPSSSGKTTTASLLCRTIEACGRPCSVISLDDFYRSEDEDYPLNEDGRPDFETIHALHLERLREALGLLAAGRDCPLPRFSFLERHRTDAAFVLPHADERCIIIEGIHALNPLIAEGLDDTRLFKLFISVSTNIVADGERILSGRKARFLRRLVRDYHFRGAGARRTLELWPDVLRGEDLYLYPYRDLADLQLDTFHLYEVGVLAPYAETILRQWPEADDEPYANYILRALPRFLPISDTLVPPHSLLREFLPER